MATISQGRKSERANLAPVKSNRKTRQNPSNAVAMRLAAAVVALVLLGVVLKYFSPGSKHAQVQAAPSAPQATPADLHVSDLQIGHATTSELLCLDGVVTNGGSSVVVGATAEVDFRDAQGKVIASMQKSIGGIASGSAGVIRAEFVKNPIQPKEIRFFRVRVEQIPPNWNHEVPELKIVEVKAQ